MGLSQFDYITPKDFNDIKKRVEDEAGRRATKAVSSAYGNDNNKDPFLTTNILDTQVQGEYILHNYIQALLNFLNNFKNFPGNINVNYWTQVGNNTPNIIVDFGSHIYALNNAVKELLDSITVEPRINDDCRSGCMGLCQGSCAGSCSGGCTQDCAEGCQNCGGCTTCSGIGPGYDGT